MIEGMAHAAAVFGRDEWLDSARRALDFVRKTLWLGGRLLATCKDGRAHLNAYLDDYAYPAQAPCSSCCRRNFARRICDWAEDIADVLLEQFEDRAGGGFFFTSHDHEKLIHRTKIGHDNATPSGNGVAVCALQRLSHLTGEARYRSAAERGLQCVLSADVAEPERLRDPGWWPWRKHLRRPVSSYCVAQTLRRRQWRSTMQRDTCRTR